MPEKTQRRAERANPGSFLIVRLSSMGDIIHTLPAFAAVRQKYHQASITWLIEDRFKEVLEEVDGLDRIISIDPGTLNGIRRLPGVIRELRRANYDVVMDFQGLVKSALLSRAVNGKRTIGFSRTFAREPLAALWYSETVSPSDYGHVIQKNFSLLEKIQCPGAGLTFPWRKLEDQRGDRRPYAVLIPGASWPHKRWPARHFGELASQMRSAIDLCSVIIQGSEEERVAAEEAATLSGGAGTVAPVVTFHQMRLLLENASLVIGGDTGPLHLASSLGVPAIGIFGPTDPRRNGPWMSKTAHVTRHSDCTCKYRRRCSARVPCITGITVEEVLRQAIRTVGTLRDPVKA